MSPKKPFEPGTPPPAPRPKYPGSYPRFLELKSPPSFFELCDQLDDCHSPRECLDEADDRDSCSSPYRLWSKESNTAWKSASKIKRIAFLADSRVVIESPTKLRFGKVVYKRKGLQKSKSPLPLFAFTQIFKKRLAAKVALPR